jgi:nicotinate-nucleotide pyrophosphorylase (carboxylating)
MVRTVSPPLVVLEPLVRSWLIEDIGRGDRTTQNLLFQELQLGQASWVAKASGIVSGLPIAEVVFQVLDKEVKFIPLIPEGESCQPGQVIAKMSGTLDGLLMGERVALNLAMRLSGIASLTRQYVDRIADLPTRLVDTRKTTPGLRVLEKYATQAGGAINHRMGLDDAVMIKDNHIAVAGGISNAIAQIRQCMPYPLTIEVETESLEQVKEALESGADIIMLDNMPVEMMRRAVETIRQYDNRVKIEASGNVTLETIRSVAETGVDYVSSSAPITQAKWLDLSMRIETMGNES